MAKDAHTGIVVDGNRIEFTVKARLMPIFGSSLLFGTILFMFIATVSIQRGPIGYAWRSIFLELLVLIWTGENCLRAIIVFSQKTVFDNEARLVRHRDLLGGKPPLPFDEVAAIAKVRRGAHAGASVLFKVARRGRRFGASWALTRNEAEDNPTIRYVEETLHPVLNQAVFAGRPPMAEAFPPAHYRQDGDAWTRRCMPSLVLATVLCLAIAFASPFRAWGLLGVVFCCYLLFAALQMSTVEFVLGEGVARLKPALLRKAVVVPFADIVGIEETYRHTLLEPIRIGLRYRVGGKSELCPLCVSYRNGKAEAVADETEALLGKATQSEPS